jgi:hypothetical protein
MSIFYSGGCWSGITLTPATVVISLFSLLYHLHPLSLLLFIRHCSGILMEQMACVRVFARDAIIEYCWR